MNFALTEQFVLGLIVAWHVHYFGGKILHLLAKKLKFKATFTFGF